MLLRAGFLFFLIISLAASAQAQTSLTGLWIDNRTGNDFWEINGNDEGFRFTAYGGSPADPRYLSRGVALALEAGLLNATIRDLPGRCCNQQGRLQIKMISPNQLEVTGSFWAMDDEERQTPATFTLSRQGMTAVSSAPAQVVLPSISYDPLPQQVEGQATPTWQGSWQGDGWARFFIKQIDNQLRMFWYYAPESQFFGLYQAEGNTARGTALSTVVKPGQTFYHHQLTLTEDPLQIEVKTRRLAAPLEDGRWVTFENAPLITMTLQKISDALPRQETEIMDSWFAGNQPQTILQNTLQQAAQSGRLIKRNYE